MTRRLLTTAALLTALFTAGTTATQATAEEVELELALLVDASGSIDADEFRLQMDGYIDAFRDPDLQGRIAEQDGVAVELYHWSSRDQVRGTGWQILRTADDCEGFASTLEGFGRVYNSSTIMAPAINTAVANIADNGIDSARQVIDVSGDGICKTHEAFDPEGKGADPDPAAWDAVINARPETLTINAISIGPDADLKAWYAANVPQGNDSFSMHAESFEAFGEGIMQKLMREIAAPSTPAERVGYD